jgi:vacuolar-type H+-ATPase subunit H
MKKIKNKIKSLFLNNKFKTAFYVVVGLFFVFFLVVISSAGDSHPEKPFYFLDRGAEKIGYLFRFGKRSMIKYELELARERIQEMKMITKPESMERLVEDYKSNLDQTKGLIATMIDNKADESEIAKVVIQTNTIYIETFASSLRAVKTITEDKQMRSLINDASTYNRQITDEIFHIGLQHITNDAEFEQYADKIIAAEFIAAEKIISYAEQDTALALDQTDTETIMKLQDIINEMNKIFADIREQVYTLPNAQKYEMIQQIKEKDKEVTKILVDITQSHLEPVPPKE